MTNLPVHSYPIFGDLRRTLNTWRASLGAMKLSTHQRDVRIASPANDQLLLFDSVTKTWKNNALGIVEDFTPVWSAGGSMTVSTDPTVETAKKIVISALGIVLFSVCANSGGLGGTANKSLYLTLDQDILDNSSGGALGLADDDGTWVGGKWKVTSSNRIEVNKIDDSVYSTGGSGLELIISGFALLDT